MLKFRDNVTKPKQCDLIEQLDATNQSYLIHVQIRKIIGEHKGNAITTCIEDKYSNIIMDQDNIRTRWFEYISVLYKDDSRGQVREGGVIWRFFLTLTIFFMLTIYTLQIKLYFVGNILV